MLSTEIQTLYNKWVEHLKLIPFSVQVDELRGLILKEGIDITNELWYSPNRVIIFNYKGNNYKINIGRSKETSWKRTYNLSEV